MSDWNNGKLYETKEGCNPKEIFYESFADELGPAADEIWAICAKFAEKGMWFDTFVILEKALNKGNTMAVGIALQRLKEIWEIIMERKIPSRLEMTVEHQETLANSFLIADLAIISSR